MKEKCFCASQNSALCAVRRGEPGGVCMCQCHMPGGKTRDEYANANIPPHVKAIDARRASEMNRVTNEKLAEWSNAISIVKANLSGIGSASQPVVKWTVDLSISALEALQAEIVEAMGK